MGVVRPWTGGVSGALRASEYIEEFAAAGFRHASVDVTRREDIQAIADMAEAAELPAAGTWRH
ncbi:hypothetical protein AB0I34_11095 [Kribbella sp. NPDC050281]|uniref:hypothetical protein n=1 Tax=Kribbella sp. NPDC050281 TaxID=3155515 RepID=UPI00340331DC